MSDELPQGWAATAIGEVADINPSGSTVVADDDQLVTFLPMAAVEELTGRTDNSRQRRFGDVKKGFTRFRDGDVLFAKITPCMENGKIAVARDLLGGVGCGSTEFHVLRCAHAVEPDYLRYFVGRTTFRRKARRNMSGAVGQQRVPVDFLRDVQLPLAPSREQKRIVSKIDELFSRIEVGELALERVQKLVERYRQSVLKAAVTGELTRAWREQHNGTLESGEALLQRILTARRAAWEKAELDKKKAKGQKPANDQWKQKYQEPAPPDTTDLPELPEEWVWASIDQLSTEVTYGTSAKCGDDASGIPVLRMGNLNEGQLDLAGLKYLPSDHHEFPALFLQMGDLLFNRTNSAELVGKSAVFRCDGQWSFASYLIRVRFITIDAAWAAHFVNSAFGRDWIGRVKNQQVGQANVNGSKLKSLAIPLPPLQELGEVLDRVSVGLSKIGAVLVSGDRELQRSVALRQSVLNSAFGGLLVKQNSTDEPASLLLKRIAAERCAAATAPKRDRKPGKRA